MVRAGVLRIRPEVSNEEYLDLLAYVMEQRPGTGALLVGDGYVVIIAEEEGELRAYVIPPEARESAVEQLSRHPALRAEIEDLGEVDIDPADYDPLAPFLPTGVRPLAGTVSVVGVGPVPGGLSSGVVTTSPGAVESGGVEPMPGEVVAGRARAQ